MKNKGFFKGMACGALIMLMILGLFAGCNAMNNKYYNPDDQETKKETQGQKETSDSRGTVEAGNRYIPNSEVLSDDFLRKVDSLIKLVDDYYLYDYEAEDMQIAMYRAIFDALGDPYSVYYTKDELEKFMESSSGTYCGIGVVVQQNMQTGIVTAVRPYLNCPGYEAGIRPGDIIYAVGGVEITGMDLNAAVSLIRGEENTTVTITIVRDGEKIDLDVVRRQINIETVTHRMLDNNIGYIQVEEFDEVTANQFKEAIEDLNDQGMEALVIDLRNNPGGLLNIVVEMCDYVIPKGVVVSVKDRDGKGKEYYSNSDPIVKVPFAVLVNENSASASEIFAGAVKDYKAGTIVGKTTFGKGIVQSIYSFRDGTGAKVTIEDYYTPSGTSIHKIGVVPDVEVDLPDELKVLVDIPEDQDTQLQKAISILLKKNSR